MFCSKLLNIGHLLLRLYVAAFCEKLGSITVDMF